MKNYLGCSVFITTFTLALIAAAAGPHTADFHSASLSTVTPVPQVDHDLLPTFEAVMAAPYEDCDLPCWWGFRPGETILPEIQAFLVAAGFDRHWQRSMYYPEMSFEDYLRFGEPVILRFLEFEVLVGSDFDIHFCFDDDILTCTIITFFIPGEWLLPAVNSVGLPQMLSQMDELPEIYLLSNSRISEYSVLLVYRQPNIVINYRFDLSDYVHPHFPLEELCLQLEYADSIHMRLDVSDRDVEGRSNSPARTTPERQYGITTEDFARFFIDNPDGCLEVTYQPTD